MESALTGIYSQHGLTSQLLQLQVAVEHLDRVAVDDIRLLLTSVFCSAKASAKA